jgi:hypothetical protein
MDQIRAFSIFQTIETSVGALYELSFAYRARTKRNEAFTLDILSGSSGEIFSKTLDDHQVSEWSTYNTNFFATDVSTTLRFTSLTRGTYGNLLDAINVFEKPFLSNKNVADVAAPSVFFLFLIAIGALGLRRYSLRNKD